MMKVLMDIDASASSSLEGSNASRGPSVEGYAAILQERKETATAM
jgi:hypothetical protein